MSPLNPIFANSSSEVLALIGLPEACTTPAISSITYANWAHLPDWIKEVLGDDWQVRSGYLGLGRKGSGANTSPGIDVEVYVQSNTDADGVLDMATSKQATRHRLAGIITGTSRVITEVWTRGKLDEFGECSVQHIEGGGRFIVVAGQTIVDIRDSRTSELAAEVFEVYAYKLLEHTVRRNSPPLTAPIIKRGPLLSLTGTHDHSRPRKIQICSVVAARFSFWFELETPIAVADASVEGSDDAVSLEECVIEEGVKVKFTFAVARQGHHLVEVHAEFADLETLVSTSQMVEVEVFYTRD
ncbi:hypothetical protein ARMGADRAFT_1030997 [Armillaria gallica]|uniref:Uncharacterized protein n=1 Tax=Armillaria gallica TaxID=47427 RepID=A0A2H3DWW8_ARMGA|nr:hypothetical protein ARMGADRAFT_1030997 [Armillaria gallica]